MWHHFIEKHSGEYLLKHLETSNVFYYFNWINECLSSYALATNMVRWRQSKNETQKENRSHGGKVIPQLVIKRN